MELTLGLAFVAGILSFVSPCVLALVPVYLAYLGETAAAVDGAGPRPAEGATAARIVLHPVLGQAALFTLSFGVIFVLAGVSIGLVGMQVFRLPLVREAAGVLVFVLGLLMTGVFGPVLSRFTLTMPVNRLPAARSARSIVLGAVFAVGWSPCIGPVLGAILTLGASTQDVLVAALLLAFYAAGLALPFLVAAVALPQLGPAVRALRRWHRPVEILAGLFIMAMGVLIYLNAFGRMASLFTLEL